MAVGTLELVEDVGMVRKQDLHSKKGGRGYYIR